MRTLFKKAAILGIALAVAGIGFGVARDRAPHPTDASSHREAPLISEDPEADNTDVYAFVSTEPGRQDFVTLIANYIPLEEPSAGPTFYNFSDRVRYEIKVDVNGDALADLTYRFEFTTRFVDPNTFLYNLGRIGLPPNPADPTSQYVNLNLQQSYTLTELRGGAATVLLQGARVAPYHIGPKSTGSLADYVALADAAIHTIPAADGLRVFAGSRDEGFYIDLAGVFDLLNFRRPGVDDTSGFNVHTLTLEVPKARFRAAGDTDGIIGVWATASRQSMRVRSPGSEQFSGPFVQVSRLANPLVNELLVPVRAKDLFNGTEPAGDSAFRDFIVNPGTSQGPNALIPLLRGVTGCTAVTGRADLEAALLTGIPAGVVPGFPGNKDTQAAGAVIADLLRLNFNIPPSASPNRLGLLGGDIAGFPNGRRVFDDTVDIDLQAAGGVLQPLVGLPACPAAGTLSDNVNTNDVPYLGRFPYLGIPHQGYNHDHDHGSPTQPPPTPLPAPAVTVPAPVLSAASKVCMPNVEPALLNLGVLNCDLFINTIGGLVGPALSAGQRLTVNLSGPAVFRLDPQVGGRDVLVVAGCPGATVTSAGAGGFTVTAPAQGCPAGTTIQVSEKLNCTANIASNVFQTVRLFNPGVELITANALQTVTATATGPGGQPLNQACATAQNATATKVCAPIVDGVPAQTTARVFTRVGQTVTCTVTITAAAGTVGPAGNVRVVLSGGSFTGAAITTGGLVVDPAGAGNIATVPCVATAANTCSFTETFVPQESARCGTLGQTVSSITGSPFSFGFSPLTTNMTDTGAVAGSRQIFVLPKADSGIICPGDVVGFVQPTRVNISCTSIDVNTNFPTTGLTTGGLLPGAIGSTGLSGVLAVGVLPSALSCQAIAFNDLNNNGIVDAGETPVAPGTIEVSSLNGALLDASGRVTTNLRIGCSDDGIGVSVTSSGFLSTVSLNNCAGVQFGVLGQAVGEVELRARYEPSTIAAQAGIDEVEGRGRVAFIAPPVALDLVLTPSIVPASQASVTSVTASGTVVGVSGTACTVSALSTLPAAGTPTNLATTTGIPVVAINTAPAGLSSCGTATANFLRPFFTVGTQLFVNPATGLPIRLSQGSLLNGTVIFTIENTSVATFGTVTGIAGSAVGFTNTVAVRCGPSEIAFGRSGALDLDAFFGGCGSVSVPFQGVNPGVTTITATFVPDLPGAFGATNSGLGANAAGILGNFSGTARGLAQDTETLTVTTPVAAAVTTIRLVPGCNNVVAPANETVAQVAARVDAASTVVSVFKQVPGTTQFQGAPGPASGNVPAGVANLSTVNALDAIFICVNAAATYRLT